MTDETVETVEQPDAEVYDITDLRQPRATEDDNRVDPDVPEFHPILEVWREVLKPARDEATKKVTPQWANRMVTSYNGVYFDDMNDFRDLYFERLLALLKIVEDEIATDDECLNPRSPEEDREENSRHYKQILIDWQVAFLGWELGWSCDKGDAALDLATLSEVHKIFFGDKGITAFLDNIKFEYTEDDQAELAKILEEMKEGASE